MTKKVAKLNVPKVMEKDKMSKPEPIYLAKSIPQINHNAFIVDLLKEQEEYLRNMRELYYNGAKSESLLPESSNELKWIARIPDSYIQSVGNLGVPGTIIEQKRILQQYNAILRKDVLRFMDFLNLPLQDTNVSMDSMSDKSINRYTENVEKLLNSEAKMTRSSLERSLNNWPMLIEGEKGCGKSVALLQFALALTQSKSHFVVYLSQVSDYVNGTFPYYPVINEKLSFDEVLKLPDSEKETLVFEQPEFAVSLLTSFKALNEGILVEKLGNPIIPACLDTSGGSKELTWTQWLDYAIQNPPLASNLVMKLVYYLMSEQRDTPVVLIIDGVNWLYQPTQYRDMTGQFLQIKRLPLLNLFKKYFEEAPLLVNEGCRVFGSLSAGSQERCIRGHEFIEKVKKESPMDSQNHLEHLTFEPYIYNMSNLSRQETLCLLQYYKSIGLIYEDFLEGTYLNEKYYMTEGNPAHVYQAVLHDNIC